MTETALLEVLNTDADLTAVKGRLRADFIMHGLKDNRSTCTGLQDRIVKALETSGHAAQIRHARNPSPHAVCHMPVPMLCVSYASML